MRTFITIVFALFALVRILADGSVVDVTDAKMVRYRSLAVWHAEQVAMNPNLRIRSVSFENEGRIWGRYLLFQFEGESQRSVHQVR